MEERVFICQVCHHTLDLRADEEGMTYLHTVQDTTDDHEPVPVPANENWAPRCDFCNIDEIAFRLPVRDFEMPGIPDSLPIHESSGAWAACTTCARLIDTNQWSNLLRHIAGQYEKRGDPLPEASLTMLAGMYRRLRMNMIGPMEPIKKGEK